MVEMAARREGRTGALLAIGVGGLVAGGADLLQACVQHGGRVPLLIAGGLLGARAEQGGAWVYALGVALHFGIALTAAGIYYAASRRLQFMTEYSLLSGLYFGLSVGLVMDLIVLPLCALHDTDPWPIQTLVYGLVQKMIVVGLPIAYGVRWFGGRQIAGDVL